MALVRLPFQLRRLAEGHEEVRLEAATVGELLQALAGRYPGIAQVVLDRSGAPSRLLGVFVNGEDSRGLGGGACPLAEGDRVELLLPLAGG